MALLASFVFVLCDVVRYVSRRQRVGLDSQVLTPPRLDEIKKAVATGRQIIEVLPHGTARDDALEALDKADEIVREMDIELSGVGAFSGTSV